MSSGPIRRWPSTHVLVALPNTSKPLSDASRPLVQTSAFRSAEGWTPVCFWDCAGIPRAFQASPGALLAAGTSDSLGSLQAVGSPHQVHISAPGRFPRPLG